jgi:hypothetical protein
VCAVSVVLASSVPARGAPARSKAAAAPANGGRPLTLVYGDDHVFGVVPPAGWVMDDSSGLGSKIRVVLYPRGQKWKSAPTVMYANPIHQEKGRTLSASAMIARDVADFQKQSPHGKVIEAPSIRTTAGQEAQVRYFSRTGSNPDEAVAYFMEDDLVLMLVLSARHPDGFRRTLPAFREMAATYRFLGSGMKTPTHPDP